MKADVIQYDDGRHRAERSLGRKVDGGILSASRQRRVREAEAGCDMLRACRETEGKDRSPICSRRQANITATMR